MRKPSKECISGYDPQDEEYRILKTSLKELLPSSFERINKSSIASWIPKQGILLFTLIFLAIFATLWLTIYIITKRSTEKMNKEIAK